MTHLSNAQFFEYGTQIVFRNSIRILVLVNKGQLRRNVPASSV